MVKSNLLKTITEHCDHEVYIWWWF